MSGFTGFNGLRTLDNLRNTDGTYNIGNIFGAGLKMKDLPADMADLKSNKGMSFKDLMDMFGLTGDEKGDVEAYKKVRAWLDAHTGYAPGELTKTWLKNNSPKSGKKAVMSTENMSKASVNNPQYRLARAKAGYDKNSLIVNRLQEKYPEIYSELSEGIN